MIPGIQLRKLRIILLAIVLLLSSTAMAQVRVVREVFLMGTLATFEVYSDDRDSGLALLEGFVRVLEDTEGEISTWRPGSVFSQLNRNPVGSSFDVDESLCGMMSELFWWHRRTDGAFDPGVGSLIDLWGLRDVARVPSTDALESARDKSGMSFLSMDKTDAGCMLTRLRDVQIDVGGFGKGEGLDRVRRFSERPADLGSENWMINFGGQVIVHGRPPDKTAWEVRLAHPIEREKTVLVVQLTSGSIATSGGSESDKQYGDQRFGHILDPLDGTPVLSTVSVAVWHEKALVADILSTALFIMGADQGLVWAEENGIAAGFLVPRGDTVELKASSRFEVAFLSED